MTEATSAASTHVDVAVIGCGTTGLVLARLLAMEGLRIAVVDPMRLPRAFPRATHLDDEAMRAFQIIGLGYLEPTFSLPGIYRFYDPQWRPVMEFPFNNGVTDQGWQSDYMFHQPDFEAVLRGLAHMDPETTHFFGWEATELSGSEEGARLLLRERASGEERELAASFVVGCDGANSFVRSTIGCEQVNYEATHRSLIVDILPFVKNERLSGRDPFVQGGIRNPLTVAAMAEPLVRIEQLLRPDDDTRRFESLHHVYELLSQWLNPDEYRIIRADVYEWEAVVAESWRGGPLILAGDAAHEMPPHLGQGMVSGIRDAMNLAWKLARVVRGESPRELLDTYESERKPHMIEYVKLAGELANQIEAMEVPVAEEGSDSPVAERQALRLQLGPGIWAADDECAGLLSAQPTLSEEQRLDDATGYRFTVLADEDCLSGLGTVAKASLGSMGAKIITADFDDARNWLKSLGAGAVVLRPDRYVFGTADSAPQLDAMVARLEVALAQGHTA